MKKILEIKVNQKPKEVKRGENANPNSVFGRIMLVFFWGGLAATIVIFIKSFVSPISIQETIEVAWGVVVVNMILVFLKAKVFKTFI